MISYFAGAVESMEYTTQVHDRGYRLNSITPAKDFRLKVVVGFRREKKRKKKRVL